MHVLCDNMAFRANMSHTESLSMLRPSKTFQCYGASLGTSLFALALSYHTRSQNTRNEGSMPFIYTGFGGVFVSLLLAVTGSDECTDTDGR